MAWVEVASALAWRAMVDTYLSAILRRASTRWPRARWVKSGKEESVCVEDMRRLGNLLSPISAAMAG